jgi:hypothetical protein
MRANIPGGVLNKILAVAVGGIVELELAERMLIRKAIAVTADPGDAAREIGEAIDRHADFRFLGRTIREVHPIPIITDPLGKYWEQPDRRQIQIVDGAACMTRKTFDQLAEYSGSVPTGVYPGKMWKRLDGVFDAEFLANWRDTHLDAVLVWTPERSGLGQNARQ